MFDGSEASRNTKFNPSVITEDLAGHLYMCKLITCKITANSTCMLHIYISKYEFQIDKKITIELVTLLFFAKSRELSGLKTSQLTTPTQASFQEILNLIVAAFPSLSTATVSVLKVLDRGVISTWKKGWNEVLCHHTIILSKTGRLVWNGMDHVEITESVLDVKHVSDLVTSPSCGAISVFIGTTRDNFNVVPLTEASIIIAISSPHRKESLEAVHFAIDTLKATVPIWKK
ncbi:hypothetical protein KUTeg_010671, partial [Tegillarca granosa]